MPAAACQMSLEKCIHAPAVADEHKLRSRWSAQVFSRQHSEKRSNIPLVPPATARNSAGDIPGNHNGPVTILFCYAATTRFMSLDASRGLCTTLCQGASKQQLQSLEQRVTS